jgi:methionine biosynthesis protein MetW
MNQFEKFPEYYHAVRSELLDMVENVHGCVLDVGCGDGSTLLYLKERGVQRTVGIELQHEQAERARHKGLDIYELNVEKDVFPFESEEFDFIILGDVLEHLFDPWQTIKHLCDLLRPGGKVLLSVPNVKYYHVMYDLLCKDKWEYADAGILDITHIRFFTLSGATSLVESAGLRIDRINCKFVCSRNKKILNFLLGGLLKRFLTYQYLIAATKA